MKKIWFTVISILVLLLVIIIALLIIRTRNYTEDPNDINKPISVIDGDTFKMANGPTVRLLCVNTPEKGQPGYEEAKIFLENLLYENTLTMKASNYGGNDTDKYGRLLRWVYITNETTREEILVNKLILEEGYGDIMIIPPETCNEVSD
jgi:micrococcal nuclease